MNVIKKLIEERQELINKVIKLDTFLMSRYAKGLDKEYISLMEEQKYIMLQYINILGKRIAKLV